MGTPRKKTKTKTKTKTEQNKKPHAEQAEGGAEQAKPEHDDWVVDERQIVRKTARPRSSRASLKGPNARKASTTRK